MRKFSFPRGCSVREVVIREISQADEEAAAAVADTMGRPGDSPKKALLANARELIRIALVAVDGKRVNADAAIPFMEMNRWSPRTLRLLQEAYLQMNGVTDEELDSFRKGSEVVLENDPSLPSFGSEAFIDPAEPD